MFLQFILLHNLLRKLLKLFVLLDTMNNTKTIFIAAPENKNNKNNKKNNTSKNILIEAEKVMGKMCRFQKSMKNNPYFCT